MRIGFFGGTFDPPHLGHRAVALAALRECSLDTVSLAPTGHQPLKPERASAPFEDRLEMVKLLCAATPGLQASAIDAPRNDGQANYTIDTIARLRAVHGEDAELFVVVGADAFLDLRRWREPERLLKEAGWIVVSRPGIALNFSPLELTPSQLERVQVLADVSVPISATEVRARLRNGGSVDDLLPANVLEYIREHHLYED